MKGYTTYSKESRRVERYVDDGVFHVAQRGSNRMPTHDGLFYVQLAALTNNTRTGRAFLHRQAVLSHAVFGE
jgi:hypothetical protein